MLNTLPLEAMSYKQQISMGKEQELLTKLRIIRLVKRHGRKRVQAAEQFQCHRNTIGNILNQFMTQIPGDIQERIVYEDGWDHSALMEILSPVKNISRRPHHHPRQATLVQQKKIAELFKNQGLKVGAKRMRTILARRYSDSGDPLEKSLIQLGIGALKGIYHREELRVAKVRTGNGQRRPLYDYTKLACFEYLHYDTKHILDFKALPPNIYQLFTSNPELPLYQWTLQDAKSRFRFLAFSRSINAEFGLKFLIYVLGYLRFIFPGWDQHITIGQDNGVEFCSGSEAKEQDWNQILKLLNASIYSYHVGHDIRKNLIERSHSSDDQELYIPRGIYMDPLPKFMQEVRDYAYYFNFVRSHSGIDMNDRTPYQVIHQSGLCGTHKLLKFSVIVLEDEIEVLRAIADHVLFRSETCQKQLALTPQTLDQKKFLDMSTKYTFPFGFDAQYLLTHYLCQPICTSFCYLLI